MKIRSLLKENQEQLKDLNLYCNNKNQYDDALEICNILDDKGYLFYINNNTCKDAVVITIKDNIQIKGQLILFDNGNWIKDVYLKNIGLYKNGKVKVNEDLVKYNEYRITGELPLNI